MIDIETARLMLRLVPRAGLAATAAQDKDACRAILGPSLCDAWFDDAWVSDLRLAQWTADEAYGPWSIRAIVHRQSGEIVGNVNFHDLPRPLDHGGRSDLVVELGYTVFEPWRRRGIATETVRALSAFAKDHGVRWVRLSISPGNVASLALARSLGAVKVGEQIDDIDGPEDIYLFEA